MKYSGVVLQQGQTIPFLFHVVEVLKKGVFRCIQTLVAESGYGDFEFDKRLKGAHVCLVAWLCSAKSIDGADTVGWHDRRFWFPTYSVPLGRSMDFDSGALLAGPNAPGANLQPPRPLTREELKQLSKCTRETRLFWALAACVAHNLTAPIWKLPPVAIGLVGAGAQVICEQAAPMLGCPTVTFPSSKTYRRAAEDLCRKLDQHHWPQCVRWAEADTRRLARWMGQYQPTNCIVPLTAAMAELAFSCGWHLVRSERYFEELDFLGQAGFAVIPAYIQDLCRRHGDHRNRGETLLEKILNDLALWFDGIGGDRRAVDRAQHVLHAAILQRQNASSWSGHGSDLKVNDALSGVIG